MFFIAKINYSLFFDDPSLPSKKAIMSVQVKPPLPSPEHSTVEHPGFLSSNPMHPAENRNVKKMLELLAFAGFSCLSLGLSVYCDFICFRELLNSSMLIGMLLIIKHLSVRDRIVHQE